MKYQCAPGKYNDGTNSCFTVEEIDILVKGYNQYVNKNGGDKIDSNQIPRKQLEDLIDIFRSKCGDDIKCILHQKFMNEIIKGVDLIDNLRPDGPASSNEWLSNRDIDKEMKQYENIYNDFVFLTAVPLDCEEHSFCPIEKNKFKFENIYSKGKRRAGIIYNLDKVGQSGSHWISAFMNLDTGEFYFSDSTGHPPEKYVLKLKNKFEKFMKSRGKNIIFKFNDKKYQKDSSECGVYSMNFIIRNLSGESFESIIGNALTYNEITACRATYFYDQKRTTKKINHLCDPAFI
jgi:hypothetical protein